jgi:hypothetical protein
MVEILHSENTEVVKETEEALLGFKQEEADLQEEVINDQDKMQKVEKI